MYTSFKLFDFERTVKAMLVVARWQCGLYDHPNTNTTEEAAASEGRTVKWRRPQRERSALRSLKACVKFAFICVRLQLPVRERGKELSKQFISIILLVLKSV